MNIPLPAQRVVIVGGGFTGTAFAIHRIRATAQPLRLTVVEPAADLGRGIAYAARDPAHRINVPSGRMSLFPDDPDHATRWLSGHGVPPDRGSTDERGHHYVPRHAYGTYVGSVLRDTLAEAGPRVRFAHRRAVARAAVRHDGGLSVALSDGGVLRADEVVLAFGHARPTPPSWVAPETRRHPKLVLDPWAAGAYEALGQDDAVLIVGTGLTMADVVASLAARDHRGRITAVSRRGLLPRPHGTFTSGLDILAGAPAPATALGVSRLLRRRIRADGGRLGWAAWADALRFDLPDLWGALPLAEKRKALRRLLPFWDVHRFRIAPQIQAALEALRGTGQLNVVRAGLVSLDTRGERLAARLRRPGGAVETRDYDAVVLCTGPARELDANPLVQALIEAGLARLDPLGIGLDVDRRSRLLDRDGAAQPDLLALGPMTRPTFGEMTGAPDIVHHIASLVARGQPAQLQA